MKKTLSLTVLAFSLFCTFSFGQDFYDINTIRVVNLDFYDDNWDFILDTMKINNNDSRILADIIVDGVTYDSVGVRFKGNSSYSPERIKNPFNIKIDYVKDQDIYGVKTMKLSNMFKDPSCVREVLSYEILRNYVPVPKANFVFLNINGNVHGLYTSVQPINKNFVEDNFGSDNNSFFKCDPVTITGDPEPPPAGCFPVLGISSPLIIMGNDSVCYQQSYEIKSDFGWAHLQNMIHALNENTMDVHEVLNVDKALWMLVFNNIFVNLDSYTGSGHNFYVYEDDYNRFNTLAWDMNENFGVFKNGGPGPSLNLDQMIHMSTKWNYTNPERPLISKLLFLPEYWHKYYAHYRTIFNDFLLNDAMKNRAVELQQLIDTFVYNDPNILYSYTDFQIALDQNIGFGNGTIPGINVLMDARTLHLSNHPELIKQGPDISGINLFPEFPISTDTVWVTANIENTTGCYLYYKTDLFSPFGFVQMFDDGNHNDAAPNDGIFGANILPVGTSTHVYYYIWAYNMEAGMFSPENAEYSSYSYFVQGGEIFTGDIAINEFLADNDTTVPDQDGEYDDWIELYNNTGEDISMSGMFLSDDYSQAQKWAFPDTVIAANAFLIVWTDNDEDQQGLHANFKLSKSGEEIILTDIAEMILDSITFGQQTTDISFGRYPNGTGDFLGMPPTFGLENQITVSVTETIISDDIKLFPNPASDIIHLEFPDELSSDEFEIEIFDLLLTSVFLTHKNQNEKILDISVSGLQKGLYLIRIGNHVKKIVVE
jgi:hypothetical protein